MTSILVGRTVYDVQEAASLPAGKGHARKGFVGKRKTSSTTADNVLQR